MKTIGSYEAKTHLSRLLDEVACGETITITRHGVPVARLVPATERAMSVDDAIEGLCELRSSIKPLAGVSLRELIEEGRR
jgi:prevent-host-death family protein